MKSDIIFPDILLLIKGQIQVMNWKLINFRVSYYLNLVLLFPKQKLLWTHWKAQMKVLHIQRKTEDYSSAVPPPPSDDNNFATEGYIKDEFTKEELISQSALSAENFGGIINSNNNPTLEGIIIDVSKEDPSGGGRTEYFDEPKSEFNMVVTIQLTKIGKSSWENRKTGDRIKFHLLDYYQMNKADLSWLEALMVPGRKIRFKSFYFGYGGEDIFYIKKLNRQGNDASNPITTNSNSSAQSSDRFVVVASKAYFYSSPDYSTRRQAYLLSGEIITVIRQQNGFVYTIYYNSKGQQTSGWIYSSDIQKQ